MRQIPGVPLIYIKRAVMVMEPTSPATLDRRDALERNKLGGMERLGKRKQRDEEDEDKPKKKKMLVLKVASDSPQHEEPQRPSRRHNFRRQPPASRQPGQEHLEGEEELEEEERGEQGERDDSPRSESPLLSSSPPSSPRS